MRKINIIGKKYGRLTVIGKDLTKTTSDVAFYLCECECGNKVVARYSNLIQGGTKSCGCLKSEMKKETARLMGLATRKELSCKICGKTHYARGLCHNCYEKERRNGTLYLWESGERIGKKAYN